MIFLSYVLCFGKPCAIAFTASSIGEHSAALSFEVSTVFMVPIKLHADVIFAQVGNDIAGVTYTATGDPQTDFDPRAELQLIVDLLES